MALNVIINCSNDLLKDIYYNYFSLNNYMNMGKLVLILYKK